MRNNMRYSMLKVNSDTHVTGFEKSINSVSHVPFENDTALYRM